MAEVLENTLQLFVHGGSLSISYGISPIYVGK